MARHCAECDRLWDDFVEATHNHLKLLSRQQIAVIQQDSAVLQELRKPVADSAAKRQAARHLVREHALTHGDEIPIP